MPSAATTTRRITAALPQACPEQLGAATVALIAAIEGLPEGSPAATAYRSALRRKGQDLADGGGPAALADALARVRADAPGRADARETALETAWTDLPGWRR